MEKRAFNRPGPRSAWQDLLEERRAIRDEFTKERLLQRDLRERAERLLAGIQTYAVRRGPAAQREAACTPRDPAPATAERARPQPASPSAGTERPAILSRLLSGLRSAGPFFTRYYELARQARGETIAGGAAALLVFAGVLIWQPFAAPLRGVYPLPHTGGAGLCVDAKTGNLYTADPARQLLFSVSAAGGRVTSVDRFPAPGLRGLACGPEGFFWSSDGETIQKHAAGKQNAVARKYAVPGLHPDALHWDGRTLWAADSKRMSVDRFLPGDRFSSIGSIRVPGNDLTGLAADEETLWVLDAADMKVYRCRLPGGENPEALELGPLLPKGARATGLAVAGGEMWIMTDKPAELRRYGLSGLRFRK